MTEIESVHQESSQTGDVTGIPVDMSRTDRPVRNSDLSKILHKQVISPDDQNAQPTQFCGSCKIDEKSWIDTFNETIDEQVKKDLPNAGTKEIESEKRIRFMDMYQKHIRSMQEENSGKEKITNATTYLIRDGQIGIQETSGHFVTLEDAFIKRMETHGKNDGSADTLRLASQEILSNQAAEIYLPVHNIENGEQKIRFVSRWWREGDVVKSEMIRMEGPEKTLAETKAWMDEHIAMSDKGAMVDLAKGVVLFTHEGTNEISTESKNTSSTVEMGEKIYASEERNVSVDVSHLHMNERRIPTPFIIGNQIIHAARETRETVRLWKRRKSESRDGVTKKNVAKTTVVEHVGEKKISKVRTVDKRLEKVSIMQRMRNTVSKLEKHREIKRKKQDTVSHKGGEIFKTVKTLRITERNIVNKSDVSVSEKRALFFHSKESKRGKKKQERIYIKIHEQYEQKKLYTGKNMEKRLQNVFLLRLLEKIRVKERKLMHSKEWKKKTEKISVFLLKLMKQISLFSSFLSEKKGTNGIKIAKKEGFHGEKNRGMKGAVYRLVFAMKIFQLFHIMDQLFEGKVSPSLLHLPHEKQVSHEEQKEVWSRPWILLAIIWQMDMAREAGFSHFVKTNNKKKKRITKQKNGKKKARMQPILPVHGVIYAYPAL